MTQGQQAAERRVFQVGAAGGVGRRLTATLTREGHAVTGMHRRPEQAGTIASAGGTPVAGDLIEDPVDLLAERLAGHDAVVFSAGAHGTGLDKTTAIDGRGLEKTADAALAAGVRRFVLVSVFLDAGRGQVNERFEHYMAVKRQADVYLAATDLDWVILRPGTLTDADGTGRVSLGPAVGYGEVPRQDVADTIAALLWRPEVNRVTPELASGPVPIEQAVSALAPRPARLAPR